MSVKNINKELISKKDSSVLNFFPPSIGKKIEKMGICTITDLFYHFPFRYEDYRETVSIKDLVAGKSVSLRVKIELMATRRARGRHLQITEAVVSDETGRMPVVWFNRVYIAKTFKIGDTVIIMGTPVFTSGILKFSSPLIKKDNQESVPTNLLPVYETTEGVSQYMWRKAMQKALLEVPIRDYLPEDWLRELDLLSLSKALPYLHFPKNFDELEKARRRLKFDELFFHQARALEIKMVSQKDRAHPVLFDEVRAKKFVASLPWELTNDQRTSAWEIIKDMGLEVPMNRMLLGDVGSGKTAVFAMVADQVAANSGTSIILAPTEVLARQHFLTLSKFFLEKDIKIGFLSGATAEISRGDLGEKTLVKKKKKLFDLLQSGEISILVSTHAIIYSKIKIKNFLLAAVDEQHRFGVKERKALRDLAFDDFSPHFLSLTATPIPRSYALALYGDLDLSYLKIKPKNRLPIKTSLISENKRDDLEKFLRLEIKSGRQVFVVCPLIENNGENVSEKKTVNAEAVRLLEGVFVDMRVETLHGAMKSAEKESIMQRMRSGEIDILVATTVIEVGVDVPNATVMVIEGAESFGLAELHQLRGRVGRGVEQSYCFLVPTTGKLSQKSADRLKFFAENDDGFKVAEFDLHTRGPGEVFGKKQSGEMQFRLATLQDEDVLKLARSVLKEKNWRALPEIKKHFEDLSSGVHLE